MRISLVLWLTITAISFTAEPFQTPPAVTVQRAPDPLKNGERPWPELPADEVLKFGRALPKNAIVPPSKPRKLLVFYRTDNYPHSSIPHWNKLIELLGKHTGAFEATFSQSYEDLTPERLEKFDAVFFNNTCRMATPEAVKVALQRFVRSGKGFAGNHGSGDNWHDWAEGTEMLGAEFVNHPYGRIQIKIDDPKSPLTAMFEGRSFPFVDEIYAFKAPYSRDKLRVLLSIDYPGSPDVAKAEEALKVRAAAPDARPIDKEWSVAARPDHDYAIAWVRPWDKGRLFYCSLGHRAEVTFDPTIVRFFLAGIQYALGDLKAEDTPLPSVSTAGTNAGKISRHDAAHAVEQHEIFSQVQFAEGLEVSLFAGPPMMNSPVFISASPDGTLFLSSDPNGSVGRERNRGRILRLQDTDDDGRADKVTEFVKALDSPRGIVAHGDTVFVLHPPHISAFRDTDGDGISDRQTVLVKNIGWSLDQRGADHASNGLELGIDGWLYAAIGDFGFQKAEGADGRTLQLRGGGIVRVRTDGSGLEVFSLNTRNVLEAAISPLLDGFARDNTNDGGGWNARFHHFTGLEDHGYPRLYKNFADEIIAPIADYGGGSGCGAVWMGEPGWPAEWRDRPIEADWGNQFVAAHDLKMHGATFVETNSPRMLAALKPKVARNNAFRPTDLDIDARGRIYLASWRDGGFNGAANCGLIFRLQPSGYQPPTLPEFEKLSPVELARLMSSPSHRTRMEAQRVLLKRGVDEASATELLRIAADRGALLETRVASIFSLRQGLGEKTFATLQTPATDPTVSAWVVRALTDDDRNASQIETWESMLLAALRSEDARTRREAVVGIARTCGSAPTVVARVTRLQKVIAERLNDPDPIVAHTAVRGLIRMRAAEACFDVLDTAGMNGLGAARVLQSLHQPSVVAGLCARLAKAPSPERRRLILGALCRLFSIEGDWAGDSWGTVPDHRGPYFQPEPWSETSRIGGELAAAVDRLDTADLAWLASELARNRVTSREVTEKLLARAEHDAALQEPLIAQLSNLEELPVAALPLLIKIAMDPKTANNTRAFAILGLSTFNRREAFESILTALTLPNGGDHYHRARQAFLDSPHLQNYVAMFVEVGLSDQRSASFATDALMMCLSKYGVSAEARATAELAVEKGWSASSMIRRRLITSARDTHAAALAKRIAPLANDPDPQLAGLVAHYFQVVGMNPKQALEEKPTGDVIGKLAAEEVLKQAVQQSGNRQHGERLFQQLGCAACHTTRPDQSLRGPFLGNTANILKRPELAAAILDPAKTIAQGFATNVFVLHDGRILNGFVVREAAQTVTIRNNLGQELKLLKSDVEHREVQTGVSMMPNGLVAQITTHDFASLLSFVESLGTKHIGPY